MSSFFLTERKPSTLRSLIRDRIGKATKKTQKNNENSTSSKKKKQQRRRFPRFGKQSNNNNEKSKTDGDEIKTVHTSSTTTVNSSHKSESENKTTTARSSSSNLKETPKKPKKKNIVEDDSDEWYASCWRKHQTAELQPSNSREPLAFLPFSSTEETIDFTLRPATATKKTTTPSTSTTATKTAGGRRAPKWIITSKEPVLKVNCHGHDDDDFILVDLEGEASAAPLEESQHRRPSLLGDFSSLH